MPPRKRLALERDNLQALQRATSVAEEVVISVSKYRPRRSASVFPGRGCTLRAAECQARYARFGRQSHSDCGSVVSVAEISPARRRWDSGRGKRRHDEMCSCRKQPKLRRRCNSHEPGNLEALQSAATAAGQAFSKQVVNPKIRLEVRPGRRPALRH